METICSKFTKILQTTQSTQQTLQNIILPFRLDSSSSSLLNFPLNPLDIHELVNGEGNEDEDDLTYEYEQFNYN